MTISTRDKKLLLVLLGIAIFCAAYFGLYNTFNNKTAAVDSEIAALAPRLEELRGHSANLSTYQAGISEIAEQVDAELAKFPSDVRSEDLLLYGASLESSVGMSVGSMSFSPAEVISQFNVPSSDEAGGVTLIPNAAFRTGLTVSGQMSYAQLKRLVGYIYSTPERTSLESLSVSYNSESGKLDTSATMAKYFICGSEYIYERTKVPSFKAGVSSPFGVAIAPANNTEGGGDTSAN